MAARKITAPKLRKMFTKSSGSTKWMVGFFVVIAILIPYFLISLMLEGPIGAKELGIAALAVFLEVVIVVSCVKMIKRSIQRKEIGKNTINSLIKRDLMANVVAEYNGSHLVDCKATNRTDEADKFSSRKNCLTENFVYAMSDCVIVPYSDIAKLYTVVYTYTTRSKYVRMHHTNRVLTAMTNEGLEFDILSAQDMFYNDKARGNIELIKSIIKEKNPSCEIIEDEIMNQNK